MVYFDHKDNIGGVDWDDIVVNPVASLLKVFSPKKVEVVNKVAGEKLAVFYTDLRNISVEQNMTASTEEHVDAGGEDISDNDSEDDDFVDSDYELEDDDDDLSEDFINGDMDEGLLEKGNKKTKGRPKTFHTSRPEQITDEDTDEEVLDIPNEESGGDSINFKSVRDEDMNKPTFSVSLVFPSVHKLREAITEYSVRNRVEIKMPRNDKIRLKAHCADGCLWNLYASMDSRVKSFVVKTYYGRHTCQKE
jgi:hypothetical protein